MTSRTEELRTKGGSERGGSGGGGSPFVRWGDDYGWLEGKMTGSFDTKYGLAVTLKVTRVCEAGLESQGRNEDGKDYTDAVRVGEEVNIGTQPTTLREKITKEDVGKTFHVAFEGWEQGKQNKYRVFTVIELTEARPAPAAASASGAPNPWDGPTPADTHDYSQDDGPPF